MQLLAFVRESQELFQKAQPLDVLIRSFLSKLISLTQTTGACLHLGNEHIAVAALDDTHHARFPLFYASQQIGELHLLSNQPISANIQQQLPLILSALSSEIYHHRQQQTQISQVQALQNQKERLELAIQGTHAGIWDVDYRTEKAFVSARLCDMLGYKKEDLQEFTKDFWEYVHPNDQARVREQIVRHIKWKEPYDLELRLKHQAGEYLWIHTRGQAIWGNDGKAERFVGSITDISERKETEQKLYTTNHIIESLLENAPASIYIKDTDCRFTMVNPQIAHDLGLKEEEILGHTMMELFPKEFAEHYINLDKQVLQTKEVIRHYGEAPLNGEIRHYIHIQFPLTDKAGEVVGLGGISLDITKQKRAEKQTQKNEMLLRTITETIPAELNAFDIKNWQYLFINYRLAEILGFTKEEYQAFQDPVGTLIHPDDRHILTEGRKKLENNTAVVKGRMRIQRKDGSYIWGLFISSSIQYEDGYLVVTMIHDISELLMAQEELRATSERFSLATKAAKLGVFEWNLLTEELKWDHRMREIHDWPINQGLPTPDEYESFIQVDDLPGEALIQATLKAENFEHEYRVNLPSGKEKYLRVLATFTLNADGTKAVKMTGVNWDITKQKQQEAAVEKSYQELADFKKALDTSLLISVTDAKGAITQVNSRFCEVTQYSVEEIIGGTHEKFELGSEDERFVQEVWKKFRKGETFRTDMARRAKDGSIFWVDSILHPVLNEQAELVEVLAVAYLIDERKRAEQEKIMLIDDLLRKNKALQDFAHVVSHNLRGPIARILPMTELFDRSNPGNPENVRWMDMIQTSTHELDQIIKDLTKVLEIQGHLTEGSQKLELHTRLEVVKSNLDSLIRKSEAKISSDFSQVSEVITKESFVHSVLFNLISNGIKFRHPARIPHIHVGAQQEDRFLHLWVQDNGRGIDLDRNAEKIFQMYERFNLEVDGRGLGLYLVSSQAEALGGRIEVESELGKGSIFHVYIPLESGLS